MVTQNSFAGRWCESRSMALVGKFHVHPPIMKQKAEKFAPAKLPTKPLKEFHSDQNQKLNLDTNRKWERTHNLRGKPWFREKPREQKFHYEKWRNTITERWNLIWYEHVLKPRFQSSSSNSSMQVAIPFEASQASLSLSLFIFSFTPFSSLA